jgi:hypothetical protein
MSKQARYTDSQLTAAVTASTSIAQVLRALGIRQAGGSHFHISKRIRKLQLNTEHFKGQGQNRGTRRPRLSADDLLVAQGEDSPRRKRYLLERALLEIGKVHACSRCGIGPTWQEQFLSLHIDHINGQPTDNRAQNLRFLCPNCHSQTPTYCRKFNNRKTPQQEVSP